MAKNIIKVTCLGNLVEEEDPQALLQVSEFVIKQKSKRIDQDSENLIRSN